MAHTVLQHQLEEAHVAPPVDLCCPHHANVGSLIQAVHRGATPASGSDYWCSQQQLPELFIQQ